MISRPWPVASTMLCDNHCDLQLGPVGDHCGDCRKRKEHGVEGENEWKFSKHSPESTVSFLMRKWNNTEVDSQNGNIIHAPIVDEKPSEASAASSFEWMQRPRHDSFKENENFDGNNNNDKQLEFPETEPVTMGRFLVQSLCDESLSRQASLSRATKPVSVKSSAKRSNKTKHLSRKLSALQSKIDTESEVYQAKMGYRPSHADKMKCEEISDLMQEKEKIKLELKDLNEDSPRKRSIDKTLEKERNTIAAQLDSLRLSVGRPYELDSMTAEQMMDERRDMAGLLGEFEKKYGVPLRMEAMAGLYERYRAVRRLCRRQSTGDLIPIPEHTPLDLTLASPRQRMGLAVNSESEMEEGEEMEARSESREDGDIMWHQMTGLELYETLGKLKESKKVYKRQIHEESGASSTETDSDIYKQYKATKYNIRLIKALIEKQA